MPEPLPDSGWSRECLLIRGAVVCPPPGAGFKPQCGVLSPLGDVPEAAVWRDGKRQSLPVVDRPPATDRLTGRHMWGGIYFGHFGHFLAETLSRTWAVRSSDAQSLIFIPKHGVLKGFQGYQVDFCKLLQIDIPITIIHEPTEVEELIVPGQGFGLGKISAGTPEFRAMMQNMAKSIRADGPEKIYISRTQFNGKGGILGERFLEANMEAAGYTVVHPQRMPLEKQLALYKAATHVVGLDSSAFHLFGFVARPEQKAAIILRRNAKAFTHIAAQVGAVLGKSLVVCNALVADWMPETQTFANHLSWGEIDHALLARRLAEQGFIRESETWRTPSDAEFLAATEKASATSNALLVRRQIDKRIEWSL